MGVAASLKRSLEQAEIEPVYLFTGNDGWTKEEYENIIFKKLSSKHSGCDKHIFSASKNASEKNSPDRIIDEANGSSLFADYKLIIVKESAVLFKNKSFKSFIKNFSKKNEADCTLVVEYENTSYAKGGVRGISQKIQYNFMLPYDNQMPGWVKTKFRDRGKNITGEGANFLIFCCSNNLFNMTKEIDKLITAYPDKKSYGLEEIREIAAAHKKENIFGYLDALTLRKEKKALMLLDDLLKYGNDPIYITGMLKWKLQQLITVKKLMIETNLPEKKILKKAGLNVYVNRGMCRNLKNYSQERLLEAYDRLFKTDIRMKSSGVDSRFLIEEYSIWFMTES